MMELTFILLYYIDISGTLDFCNPILWNRNHLGDRESHLFTKPSYLIFIPHDGQDK
jgi:hypothetical protein